jgi:hypothetical protein
MMRQDGGVWERTEIKEMMFHDERYGRAADGGFYMRMTPCGSD